MPVIFLKPVLTKDYDTGDCY